MLKIRDNVDLKELEKYGFKLIGDKISKNYIKKISDRNDYNDAYLIIAPITNILLIETHTDTIRDKLDILYDLIKADLVEKVEE